MKFMLDTNICSYIIKHKPLEVLAKFNSLNPDDICISSITFAELNYWVARNKRLHAKSNNQGSPKVNEQVINNFVTHLDILEFDSNAAILYGDIRDCMEGKGLIVGEADLLIGAHALSLNLTLITNNTKDFINFPNIKLENWVS